VIRIIVMILFFWGSAAANASACPTEMMNPWTDVAWNCIYPLRIGGVSYGPSGTEPSNGGKTVSPVCTCPTATIPRVGLGVYFWDPSRMIDTVSDPWCIMPLGSKIMDTGGKLGGALNNNEGQSRAFQQVHYTIFPAWNILGMFYDIPCIQEKSFDILFATEVMPTWNNEFVSMLVNPEAVLFANPFASLACAADALMTISGFPVNSLFWCMGSWGSTYPLAGSITAPDYVTANAGLAARSTYLLARLGILREYDTSGCYSTYAPIWTKDSYKFQLVKPVRDSSCRPIGQTGLLWSSYKHPPMGGDNFMWMQFRRMNCCASYY